MAIICSCDVCKKTLATTPIHHEDIPNRELITVRFDTEQDEGRSCKPYLQEVKIHICRGCKERIAKSGRYLGASGAQGYNNYYFND